MSVFVPWPIPKSTFSNKQLNIIAEPSSRDIGGNGMEFRTIFAFCLVKSALIVTMEIIQRNQFACHTSNGYADSPKKSVRTAGWPNGLASEYKLKIKTFTG